MKSALGNLQEARRRLKYNFPYKIVVLGESGDGKSTLVNAIIGRDMLITGTGRAVTVSHRALSSSSCLSMVWHYLK